MKIGVMNDPRRLVTDEIPAIGRAAYDFVDLTLESPNAREFDTGRVKNLLNDYGLSIVGHTDPTLPYAYPLASVREACLQELERCAAVFAELGAKIMNIHPCYACPPTMKNRLIDLNLEALWAISNRVRKFGLTLALENFKSPFDSTNTFRRILKAIPGLKLHLDFGHGNFGASEGVTFCSRLRSEIVHVHFSDNRGYDDHHMPLGVGSVDWRSCVQALKSIYYEGGITLEIFSNDATVRFDYLEISRRLLRSLWEER